MEGEKPIYKLDKFENYLLPVYGVKATTEMQTEPGTYYIYICESHIPREEEYGFKIDHATAKLHKSLINIID